MTAEKLMAEIEGYYGTYPAERKKARAYTLKYLSENFSDKWRMELWRRVRVEFSGRYRAVPDIADLEAVRRKMLSEPHYEYPALPDVEMTDEERTEMAEKLSEFREGLGK